MVSRRACFGTSGGSGAHCAPFQGDLDDSDLHADLVDLDLQHRHRRGDAGLGHLRQPAGHEPGQLVQVGVQVRAALTGLASTTEPPDRAIKRRPSVEDGGGQPAQVTAGGAAARVDGLRYRGPRSLCVVDAGRVMAPDLA